LNRASRKEADIRLQSLRRQVLLHAFTTRLEDGTCREARQAAGELAETTSRLSVEISDATECGDLLRKFRVDAVPVLVATAKDAPEYRLYGVPLSYALVILLDALASLGNSAEPKDELVSILSGAVGRGDRSSTSSKLDLVVSRRDPAGVEAAAALHRVALASAWADRSPHVVSAVRVVEDFPLWTALIGGSVGPTVFLDGKPVHSWPFADTDLAEIVAGGSA
jgi:hypothetical protein